MYKIAIITTVHWSYGIGGTEYQAKLLVEELCHSENVEILYLSRGIGLEYKPDCYKLEKIANDNPLQRYALFIDGYSLYRKLKKFSPNIIYQRGGTAYTGIAAFYARINNCKFILHIASDNGISFTNKGRDVVRINRTIDNLLLKYGIKNASMIIAQTNRQKIKIQKLFPSSLVEIIPNYHPAPPQKTNQKSNTIIWVANFKILKQPELFIMLSKELERKGIEVKCLMVGKPAKYPVGFQKKLESQIDKQNNLKYIGSVSTSKVNDLIAQSKILINTSKWEGFPNTFIQAWQRETAVISLNVDPDNVFEKYQCGIVSGNFSKMVEDTIRLLSDNDYRIYLTENAKIRADQNYSMKNLNKLKNRLLQKR